MPRAYKLLSTLFNKGKTKARLSSRKKDKKETVKNRLLKLRKRRPKKIRFKGHFQGM
jgi:hypothetical protein